MLTIIKSRRLKFFGILMVLGSMLLISACGNPSKNDSTVEAENGKTKSEDVNYPEKEVTLIVPWAAGGGTDAIGRQIATLMEQELGKPVITENREGGGGAVGFKELANAEPDGYTIGFISNSLLLQKYSSDTFVDYELFNPITLVNEDPASIIVKNDAPWDTVEEFLNDANNKEIKIGNSGVGGIWHVAGLALEDASGKSFTHVPYDGANPAAVAAAGGFIDATTVSPAEVQSLVDAEELRILAVTSEERLPQYPDIPTLKEGGVDLSIGVWRGFVAPKDTPDEIIEALDAAITKAVESEDYQTFMENAGYGIQHASHSEFSEYMKEEDETYKDLFENMED